MTLAEYFKLDWQSQDEVFQTWAEHNGYDLEQSVHTDLLKEMLRDFYTEEAA